MKYAQLLFSALLFFTPFAHGLTGLEKELLYKNHSDQLKQIAESPADLKQERFDALLGQFVESSDLQQNLLAQALSDLLIENPHYHSLFASLNMKQAPAGLHLQLFDILDRPQDIGLDFKLVDAWTREDDTLQRKICALSKSTNPSLIAFFSRHETIQEDCAIRAQAIAPPSAQQIRDLLTVTPDARNFQDGKYFKKPKIFQVCRTNRNYTCQMIIKDGDGRWVKNSDGTIWSQEKLSLSKQGKAFNEFSGETPAGVYTIEGVMPTADSQLVFGKFRRLILEFIPVAKAEATIKSLLPSSNHTASWWNESTIARDMGRDLFRIHGTLRRNDDPKSTYYPFHPTAGCVASKEGTYDGVEHIEQRHLLDQLMAVSGLQPIYENETRLLALFYVVELNSEQRAVTKKDLATFGVR